MSLSWGNLELMALPMKIRASIRILSKAVNLWLSKMREALKDKSKAESEKRVNTSKVSMMSMMKNSMINMRMWLGLEAIMLILIKMAKKMIGSEDQT